MDGVSLLKASHDEAVNVLKNTGPAVKLVIKHYQVANQFLKRSSEYIETDKSVIRFLETVCMQRGVAFQAKVNGIEKCSRQDGGLLKQNPLTRPKCL